MRIKFTQILAVFFLLILVGNKTVEISQQIKTVHSIERVFSSFKGVLKFRTTHFLKGNKSSTNASILHLDDSSLSDSDVSDLLDLVATYAKIIVFAFLLSLTNTKFIKHRFYYDAFIRLFSHKYIVLRNLRI